MADVDRQRAEIIKLAPQVYYSRENQAALRRVAAENAHHHNDAIRPDVDPCTDFLFVTTEGGRPVMYENRDGRRLTNKQMLYPPPQNRGYYQEGDVILIAEFEERIAEQVFPELKGDGGEEHPSLLIVLAKGLLGIKPDKFRLGQKIVKIKPGSRGTGEIHTHVLLFLGKTDFVEMDVDREFSRRDLADSFAMTIYGPKPEVADFLEAYCEFIGDVAWGLEKESIGAITKWGVKKAASYAAKKEGKHLVAEWFKSSLGKETKLLAKATFNSGKKFASNILKQNEKRQLAGRFPGARVEPLNMSAAASEACLEFAKTLIDEQWEVLLPSMTKKLGEWLKVDEVLGATAKQKATMWLAKKLADGVIHKAPLARLEANLKALNDAPASKPKEYQEIVDKAWEESVKDFFKESLKEICEGIGKEAIGESESE